MEDKKNLLILTVLSIVFLGYGLTESQGLVHRDSLSQFLEPGYKLAEGYGITVWEYQVGYRPYLHSLGFAAVIKTLKTLGLYNPLILLQALDFLTAAFLFGAVILTYFLGKKTFCGQAGFYAALFTLFSPLTLLYGTRFNIHPQVTVFLLASYLLISSGSKKKIMAAGAFIGLAFCLRYTVILLVPLFLFQSLKLKKEKTVILLLLFLFTTLLWGFVDLVGWGSLLHSLKTFITLGLFGGYSNVSRIEHPLYYVFFFAMHIPAVYTSTYVFWDKDKKILPAMFFLVYLISLSFVGHKEPRYLVDVYPFFMLYAGRGLLLFTKSVNQRTLVVFPLIFFSIILSILLPEAFIGWGSDSPMQALTYAGGQEDVKALAYTGLTLSEGFPSYFFFDRNTPQLLVGYGYVVFPKLNPNFSSKYSGLIALNCSAGQVNLSDTEFQCLNPGKALNDSRINYFIAPRKTDLTYPLEKHGFNVIKTFDGVNVYRRCK
ncbi:MAG: hypothetical protein GF334_10025 [Candidatus Altiarchaeales archaeon]|nr:hypothetical protein [Candidatus Altiarchaeales archaeon]